MKRTATETLRRGFESTVANWPLIVLRIVEMLVFIAIVIGAIVATIVPFAVSAGLGNLNHLATEQAGEALAAALLEHWMLFAYALLVMLIVCIVLVAIHSFVEAGTAQVLVDAERANAGKVFRIERWLQGGTASWWRIFWIYNLIWGVAGVVMLLPLVATIAGALLMRDNTGRIVIACAGLALSILVLLPVVIIATVWGQKAIAVAVSRNVSAAEAVRSSRQQVMADFGRHFVVALIIFIVSFGGSMLISMLGAPLSLIRAQQPLFISMTAPVQIVISVAQSIFSGAVGTWFLASYIALTEER